MSVVDFTTNRATYPFYPPLLAGRNMSDTTTAADVDIALLNPAPAQPVIQGAPVGNLGGNLGNQDDDVVGGGGGRGPIAVSHSVDRTVVAGMHLPVTNLSPETSDELLVGPGSAEAVDELVVPTVGISISSANTNPPNLPLEDAKASTETATGATNTSNTQ